MNRFVLFVLAVLALAFCCENASAFGFGRRVIVRQRVVVGGGFRGVRAHVVAPAVVATPVLAAPVLAAPVLAAPVLAAPAVAVPGYGGAVGAQCAPFFAR